MVAPWLRQILRVIDCHAFLYQANSHAVICNRRFRRYVCEDRYTAIRWAIAAAQKGDVVVIAGKGDKDWTEVSDGEDGYIRVRLLLSAGSCFLDASVACHCRYLGTS